jgi:hypothetical protein
VLIARLRVKLRSRSRLVSLPPAPRACQYHAAESVGASPKNQSQNSGAEAVQHVILAQNTNPLGGTNPCSRSSKGYRHRRSVACSPLESGVIFVVTVASAQANRFAGAAPTARSAPNLVVDCVSYHEWSELFNWVYSKLVRDMAYYRCQDEQPFHTGAAPCLITQMPLYTSFMSSSNLC